jgi:hypothetical protein
VFQKINTRLRGIVVWVFFLALTFILNDRTSLDVEIVQWRFNYIKEIQISVLSRWVNEIAVTIILVISNQ